MKHVLVILVAMFGFARAERPAPPEPAIAQIVATSHDVQTGFANLVEQLDEPVGLAATANDPKLGLFKGDLVRAINGQAAVPTIHAAHVTTGIVYLDVLRGKKQVEIRIAVKLERAVDHMDRERFQDHLVEVQRNPQFAFQSVTSAGHATGVLVRYPWFGFAIEEGDVIRTLDGKPVVTPEALIAALDANKDQPSIALELERLGQPFDFELHLVDPEARAK
jgi:S1-C subfamily serine protease